MSFVLAASPRTAYQSPCEAEVGRRKQAITSNSYLPNMSLAYGDNTANANSRVRVRRLYKGFLNNNVLLVMWRLNNVGVFQLWAHQDFLQY